MRTQRPTTQGYGALIIILLSAAVFLFWIFELPRITLPGETSQEKAARLAKSSNLLAYVPLANKMSGAGTLEGKIQNPSSVSKIILSAPLANSAVSNNGIISENVSPIAILLPNPQGTFRTQLPSGSYAIIVERKDGLKLCGTTRGYFSACTVSVSANKTTSVTIP